MHTEHCRKPNQTNRVPAPQASNAFKAPKFPCTLAACKGVLPTLSRGSEVLLRALIRRGKCGVSAVLAPWQARWRAVSSWA